MTAVTKDQISSVAISLRVDGKPSFMLLLTSDGDVKRMGFSAVHAEEKTVAAGHDPALFEQVLATLPDALLGRGGTYEDPGTEGERCHWRIELGGTPDPIGFELIYYSKSAGLPKALAELVATAESLTDPWYAEHLGPGTDTATDTAPAPDEEPAPAEDEPAAPVVPSRPAASKKRIALAVLLDFVVLQVPYTIVRMPFTSADGGGGPPGGGLVVFAIVEFCLLQFARWSPGYGLLGMRAALGDVARVDPARIAGESLVTHLVGVVCLSSGLGGTMAWASGSAPIPYFGLGLGPVLSALFSALLGIPLVAAGVLILRNDLRGVWIGSGVTALSFLSMWLARGTAMASWMAAEVALRAELQGRPVMPGEAETAATFVAVFALGFPLVFGVGLYFCWKRLRPPSIPESAAAA